MAISLLAALGLSAVYTIPAFFERRLVRIDRLFTGGFAVTKNMVELKWMMQPGFFYVGMPILLGVALVLVLFWWRRARPGSAAMLACGIATAVLLLAMLPLARPIWPWLPLSRFMQFPWRLLGFVAVSGAVLLGLAWAVVVPERGGWRWVALALVSAAIIHDGERARPRLYPMEVGEVPTEPGDIVRTVATTTVSDEYLPRWAIRPTRPVQGSATPLPPLEIERASRGPTDFQLVVKTPDAGALEVQSLWFPGWRVVTRSGPAAATALGSPEGRIRVELPRAGRYELAVEFGLTPLRAAASGITLGTLAGLLYAAWRISRSAAFAATP